MKKIMIPGSMALILILSTGSVSMSGQNQVRRGPNTPAVQKRSAVTIDFGRIPLYFTPNRGQADERARFYAKTSRYTLWLTEEGLVFDSRRPIDRRASGAAVGPDSRLEGRRRGPVEMERDVSRLRFLNASKRIEIVPLEETPLKVNYFIGAAPSEWRAAVPTYGSVLYKGVYEGIDLKVYGIESRIEYDWIVRPGGDPRDIVFEYTQVKGTRIDENGNLAIETRFGEMAHQKPVAFQGPARSPVVSGFRKAGGNAYGFDVGPYDARRDLIIDPVVLAYSTYLGGASTEEANDIAVDGSGRAFVTGSTDSSDFPTLDQYQTDLLGRDVFVAMLDTTQAGAPSLLYATYLGGSGSEAANGIAVDASGYVYVAGYTGSANFPTLRQYQADRPGLDAFVTKLDPSQSGTSSLLFSTYLGGSGEDYGSGIAAAPGGYAYIVGDTVSTDFPTLNPYQNDQTDRDVFVTKLDTTKSGSGCLIYSTYLGGGSSVEYGLGIAADGIGNAYVTGYTDSTDFPVQSQYQTDQTLRDAFAVRLDTTQSGAASLVYSTYLGGSSDDYGYRITADGNGRAFVVGFTDSPNFPTVSPYLSAPGGGNTDVFVAKIDTAQSGSPSLLYSTYVGGSGTDFGYGIAVDTAGVVTITGTTNSVNFPTLNAYQTDPGDSSSDVFVARLDPGQNGTASLIYSTYLGGSLADEGQGIAMDSSGYVYVTGSTNSAGFPTLNQYQTDQVGMDAFVTKIYQSGLSSSLTLTSPNGGETWFMGSSHDITWTSTGLIANVKVEYSTNNGSSWTVIAASTPNDGRFSWTVPSAATTQGLIRVSDASNATVNDVGAAAFSIATSPTITVTSPNGGEAWVAGSAHDITWTTTGTVGNVQIEYSTDNGASWIDVAASTANDGTHPWALPASTTTQGLVRIKQAAGAWPFDASDAVFTIESAPTITVTSPNGGEAWVAGSAHDITWTTTGTVGNVRIEYSLNNGGSWTDVAASTANDGTHPWTLPASTTTQGLVRISHAAGGAPSDMSDAVFSIASAPTITVTSPNGGEEWIVDSAHDITWTTTGTVGNVRIEYSLNNGGSWTDVVASTANDGTHPWTVPSTASAQCLVRISQAAGGGASDSSDAAFAISLPPTLALNRTRLNFGAQGGTTTSAQNVTLSHSGATPHWTATPSAGWISATPGSGADAATVAISVDPTGLAPGAYSGTVAFADPSATNSPQSVAVYLTVYDATQPPFGDFATPTDGATSVTGAIPVTGWVLDDIETTKVEIWRDPVLSAGELNSLYFIGNGLFVEGPRPDIETGYPASPKSYAAGWGYMLLTNFLPNHGNGIYKLYAIATDKEGNQVTLGTKTITCDNAHAVKPFGTIDTPGQGGTASGNKYVNFGWVLTPLPGTVPKDGHLITVYVDSVLKGNLSGPPNLYNAYRSDVSNNFPGFNNTGGPGPGQGGPVGAFFLDTTGYANGVHTIFWIAYDDQGQGDGIGSRFFTIANVSGAPEPAALAPAKDLSRIPTSFVPVPVKTGLDLDAELLPRYPDAGGIVRIEIPEVSRMEVELGGGAEAAAAGGDRFAGHMIVGGELRPLPAGSTLDRRTGRFSWMPGPGFVGDYDLAFRRGEAGPVTRVRVSIVPKNQK